MGLRVNTNVFSLNAQRNLVNVSDRLAGNFARLSSGLRIASASDDAAGLGISERMRSQIRSLDQAGFSLVQTAEGSLGEQSSNLVRMRELAIQAANGTLNSGDRAVIDTEFQALISEIERLLAPGGILFIGHSETLTGIRTGLTAVRPSVYRKPVAGATREVEAA